MIQQDFSRASSRNRIGLSSLRRYLKIDVGWLLCWPVLVAMISAANANAQQAKPVPARAPAIRIQLRNEIQVVSEQQFDAWVFRQDRTPEAARWRLDSLLELQIDEFDRACKLSAAQKQKLQLMGRGDIKRFFGRYETAKEKLHESGGDRQIVQELTQEANPLSATLQAGLFGETSLLRKSIPNVLTSEQLTHYQSVIQEQMHARHMATINLVVTSLEQAGKFRDAERQKFIDLMTRETKLRPKPGQYDFYYLLGQLGRLPQTQYKPLLTDAQWEMLNKYQTQFERLEPLLRQAGYFVDEGDEARPPIRQRMPSR